jgi:hypothetical protein
MANSTKTNTVNVKVNKGSDMENLTMMQELNNKASNLTPREKKLWNQIRANSGVLMAYGIPGISKSATFRSIAEKMDLQYLDLRTSTMDETDLGAFPTVSEIEYNGKTMKVVDQTVPAWAIKANERPTLIHFEELNRCSANVRSAALGILLEKIIGSEFKFNENVFMVASGNPSTEHDMDVEEFGSALRNRLIPIQFELNLQQWKNEFADENVIPEVVSFLTQKPDYFGNTVHQLEKFMEDDNMTQYPSPRSWTFLSDYIKMYADDPQGYKAALQDVTTLKSYVGEIPAVSFVNYVLETFKVSVTDVLEGKDFTEFDSMTTQRIIQEFQDGYKFHNISKEERENWIEFMKFMSPEIRSGHLATLVKESNPNEVKEMKIYKKLIKLFKDDSEVIVNAL